MATRHPLAPIERLPTELIHRIFFECLEFNLPLASPTLRAALSSEVLYTWLVRLAFSGGSPLPDSALFGSPYLTLDYYALNAFQRAALQTNILSCRWCTATLVRKCQRQYVQHIIAQKCTNLVMSEEDEAKLRNLDHEWDTSNWRDQVGQERKGRGDLVINARDRDTGNRLTIAVWFNYGAVQIREPTPVVDIESDVFRLPCGNFPEACRMPDRLLQPPWTEDKYDLFAMFSTEAYIDENNSCERSRAVMRQLIHERDIATFERLLMARVRVKLYGYTLRWPVRPNDFRYAARCAQGDDDPFLIFLFTHRRDEVPRTDPALRALLLRYDRQHGS